MLADSSSLRMCVITVPSDSCMAIWSSECRSERVVDPPETVAKCLGHGAEMSDAAEQYIALLQTFLAIQQRHEGEQAALASEQLSASADIVRRHVEESTKLRSRHVAELKAFSARLLELQEELQADLKHQRQQLQAEQESLAAEKASMQADGVSGGDIPKLTVCGERTSATRGVSTQAQPSILAAKSSGRWEGEHDMDEQGYIFLEYDPYCFSKILGFLRSKAIEHPDYPSPRPVIAAEHEAQYNQLVSYLGLDDFVGLVGLQFCFDNHGPAIALSHNHMVASFESGHETNDMALCLLSPTMQPGKVYYLKFVVCSTGADDFIGVSARADSQRTKIMQEDAGWGCKGRALSGGRHASCACWDGWQAAERYFMKVDLISNVLHSKCLSEANELNLPIDNRSGKTMHACLQMSRSSVDGNKGSEVKLLPVLKQDIDNY